MFYRGIALSGKFCSGKDTLAKFLEEELSKRIYAISLKIEISSFAKALKDLASLHCAKNAHIINGVLEFVNQFPTKSTKLLKVISNTFEEVPKIKGKNRELLQKLGVRCREIIPDIWIKCFENSLSCNKFYILSDLRFKNEAEFCRKNRFVLLRLECDNKIRLKRAKRLNYKTDKNMLNHISEIDLDNYDFDFYFENNKKVKDLENDILPLLNLILLRG